MKHKIIDTKLKLVMSFMTTVTKAYRFHPTEFESLFLYYLDIKKKYNDEKAIALAIKEKDLLQSKFTKWQLKEDML